MLALDVAYATTPRRRPKLNVSFGVPNAERTFQMASNRYVKQNAGGSWEVLKEGHRRSIVQASSKQAAVDRARSAVRREGGGEIRIMNRAGKMIESRNVTTGVASAGRRARTSRA